MSARARFVAGIFTSAMLLFTVQPMTARLIVPLLGGAPQVWIVCSLVFQALLLGGYAWAHLLGSRAPLRLQIVVQCAIAALAFLSLPVAVDEHGARALVENHPTAGLTVLVLKAVGIPFFVLSTTSPLLQRWFAEHGERDPYHLYAASNAGSILALVGYPLVIEPRLGTTAQARAFQVGYAIYVLVLVVCGATTARGRERSILAETPPPPPVAAPASVPPALLPRARWQQRLVWIALAFVPSSLLLGATEYVTTEVASVPLLWLVPLGLYLVSFIVAFAEKSVVKPETVGRVVALMAPAVLFLTFGNVDNPVILVTLLHLAYLFAAAVLCHQALASLRPSVARLTEFYLLLSVGGALGGMWNGIVAPALFTNTREYPLAVLLACFARVFVTPREARTLTRVDAALVAGLGLVGLVVFQIVVPASSLLCLGVAGALLFAAYTRSARPLAYAVALLVVHLAIGPSVIEANKSLWAKRSFFGTLRVTENGTFRMLAHGVTLHGVQSTDPAKKRIPFAYYHPEGPVGDVLGPLPAATSDAVLATLPPRRVGVIGLGVGALAAYARHGDAWTFFEINPDVVEVARSQFSFLSEAEKVATVRLEVGDARLRIADSAADRFDVLVLDAFTSDAIPVHLLTREAFRVYRRAIASEGLVLVHVSNRHVTLAPVLAAIAEDAGMTLSFRSDLDVKRSASERTGSQWAVLSVRPEQRERLVALGTGWRPIAAPPGQKVWTDDYANLLGAMRF